MYVVLDVCGTDMGVVLACVWHYHVCGTGMCVVLAASWDAVWSDEGNYAEMCRRVSSHTYHLYLSHTYPGTTSTSGKRGTYPDTCLSSLFLHPTCVQMMGQKY